MMKCLYCGATLHHSREPVRVLDRTVVTGVLDCPDCSANYGMESSTHQLRVRERGVPLVGSLTHADLHGALGMLAEPWNEEPLDPLEVGRVKCIYHGGCTLDLED